MEVVGRKWLNRVALGLLAALLPAGLARLATAPVLPAPVETRPVAARPFVDFEGLYSLDHLVLEGDPILELHPLGSVAAGRAGARAVPEPAPGALWILVLTAVYTLNLRRRSW